jgi:hypothetical protein
MSDIPVCIDISHHQGFPDFDEVKAAGVLGVIHKATEHVLCRSESRHQLRERDQGRACGCDLLLAEARRRSRAGGVLSSDHRPG